MESGYLLNVFVFLAAACVVVSLASRFRLGSVLGYLIAGILIGPFGLEFIGNPKEILHFAEFGVVMMLFLIGMELDPTTLWRLRRIILGLGGLQVLITTTVFALIGLALGYHWQLSLAVSMALSLSSTALVLQMLQEKGLMHTSAGESAFSVLLFQDIAVIPILVALPFLALQAAPPDTHSADLLGQFPAYIRALIVAGTIISVILIGRYLSRHLFRFIAKTHLREVFTATSLALVVGITLLMLAIGISPALGAFVAGVVLANSEYKHTIETDIEPFKGLLLGLFFISVGMGMDFDLLRDHSLSISAAVAVLIITKAVILFGLGRAFGLAKSQDMIFSFALAQGGEFAFVLLQFAGGLNIISSDQSSFLMLTVALSMASTPLIMMLNDRFVTPFFMSVLPARDYDIIEDSDTHVIIAGYGRFGQIIGRFMSAQGVPLTILESDPDQIELLRRFENKVYYGDASHPELLRNAGAAKAKLLIVAIDDADKILEIVRIARNEFPHLTIFARARNRRHAYELDKAGANYFQRETFDSSLAMAKEAMKFFGFNAVEMSRKARKFKKFDEKMLRESFAFFDKERELIDFARQSRHELERILQSDQLIDESPMKKDLVM